MERNLHSTILSVVQLHSNQFSISLFVKDNEYSIYIYSVQNNETRLTINRPGKTREYMSSNDIKRNTQLRIKICLLSMNCHKIDCATYLINKK